MLNTWRQPVISYFAILATVVVAALPMQLLANCCCRQADETGTSCCQPSTTDETAAACCCSSTATAESSCCSTQPENVTDLAGANACCEAFAATQSCDCSGCGETPVAPPVVTSRSEDAPRVDLTFLAIPAVGISLALESKPAICTLSPDEGYLPPPVRERFCVWTI